MTNLKQKLTSRKFWLALVGFITPLLIAFGMAENEASEVAAIIMAGADVIVYVFTEGVIDANAVAASKE